MNGYHYIEKQLVRNVDLSDYPDIIIKPGPAPEDRALLERALHVIRESGVDWREKGEVADAIQARLEEH